MDPVGDFSHYKDINFTQQWPWVGVAGSVITFAGNMRIGVNTRFLLPGQMEGYGNFVYEIFTRLATDHPEHTFFFLFDRPYDPGLPVFSNVKPVVIGPRARHYVLFKWWFDVKLPLALRRLKIDVFISSDGFCSLTTSVPQVVVVHDLAFLYFPRFIHKLHLLFYRRYTPMFLKKAKVVATVSFFSKQNIIEKYGVNEKKVLVVHSAAKQAFKPLDWQQREEAKEKYAGGCEYFVFVGGLQLRKNFMNVLKAFSQFKKRQQSNMKLLVAGRLQPDPDMVIEKLKTYKFKADVLLMGYIPANTLPELIGAAYALVYPSYFEGFGVPIIEAMQCGVPVITGNASSMPEVAGGAALLVNADDPVDIADKMKTIYKDEGLRQKLVAQGLQNAAIYSWQKTSELLWEAIQQAVYK